jgi:hypothetical protein
VKAIQEQEAEGLFGIGAKLAALPTQEFEQPAYDLGPQSVRRFEISTG